LEKDRELRYQSASDLRTDLRRLKRDSTSGKIEAIVESKTAYRRSFGLLLTTATLLVAIVAATLWWIFSPAALPKITGFAQITHDGLGKEGLLTDGTRIYFTEDAGGHLQISQLSITGGEPISIPTHFANPQTLDISADGSELLIETVPISEGEHYFAILPLPGGSPRPLPFTGLTAAWSPDGKQTVICKGSELYLADHDGAGIHKLLTTKQAVLNGRFSPDGSHIRFTLVDIVNATSSLWEVRTDGTGLRALLPGWNNPPTECCGKWTADGSYYQLDFGLAKSYAR
jgi:Tol biopolymer transport system component